MGGAQADSEITRAVKDVVAAQEAAARRHLTYAERLSLFLRIGLPLSVLGTIAGLFFADVGQVNAQDVTRAMNDLRDAAMVTPNQHQIPSDIAAIVGGEPTIGSGDGSRPKGPGLKNIIAGGGPEQTNPPIVPAPEPPPDRIVQTGTITFSEPVTLNIYDADFRLLVSENFAANNFAIYGSAQRGGISYIRLEDGRWAQVTDEQFRNIQSISTPEAPDLLSAYRISPSDRVLTPTDVATPERMLPLQAITSVAATVAPGQLSFRESYFNLKGDDYYINGLVLQAYEVLTTQIDGVDMPYMLLQFGYLDSSGRPASVTFQIRSRVSVVNGTRGSTYTVEQLAAQVAPYLGTKNFRIQAIDIPTGFSGLEKEEDEDSELDSRVGDFCTRVGSSSPDVMRECRFATRDLEPNAPLIDRLRVGGSTTVTDVLPVSIDIDR